MAKLLQANLSRSAPAYNLLRAKASKTMAEVLIISEPSPRSEFGCATWDTNGTAIVQKFDTAISETVAPESGPGYAKRVIRGIAVYSCYYSPSDSMEKSTRELDALEESVRRSRESVVVAGDFNSKSPSWSRGPRDARGTVLSDLMAALGLVLGNETGRETFHRGDYPSVLDLSFISPALMRRVSGWEVLDTEALSDHATSSSASAEDARHPKHRPQPDGRSRNLIKGSSVKRFSCQQTSWQRTRAQKKR